MSSAIGRLAGLISMAIRAALGARSWKSPSRFAAISWVRKLIPVALPPGRARLATRYRCLQRFDEVLPGRRVPLLLVANFTEVESGNALLHHRMPAMIETVLTMTIIRTVMDEHRENCQ